MTQRDHFAPMGPKMPKPYRPRRLKRSWRIALITLAAMVVFGAGWIFWAAYLRTPPGVKDTPGYAVEIPDWIDQQLLPLNQWSRPGRPLMEVNGVVVHYVGNPGTSAQNNRDYFANLALTHQTYASSHFVVGLEGEIIQCVPLSEISFCSNDRNDDTIAIEVCHPDETGEFLPETRDSLVRLTAFLCESFGLEEDQIIRHYDVSGKICPRYYVEHPEAWDALKEQIAAAMAPSPAKETAVP